MLPLHQKLKIMRMDTTIKEQLEQMDLLQAFEMIVDKAKDSALGEKFYQEAEPYLNFVAEKLGISKRHYAFLLNILLF